MLRILRKHAYSRVPVLRNIAKYGPIGVDMGDDTLKVAQLGNNEKCVDLIAGGSENRPEDVEPGSGGWQRWAIEAIRRLIANGRFQGREVMAAVPASEVFIDHIKMPKIKDESPKAKKGIWGGAPFAENRKLEAGLDGRLQDAMFSEIRQKLPFEADDAVIKYIPTEEDNVLVIATEREKIDRHLAIYEKAHLQIKSIAVWPAALTNSYIKFFGRREVDIETVVMLLDVEANYTNVVICRHKNLLFARSIPVGAKQLDDEKMITRLVLELTGCKQHFGSMYRKARIERLIFLSGQAVDKDIYATIAKQLEMPAQMGDCLRAVEIADPCGSGIDRRGCQLS
ncbi:MAG: pilus assembly protein PilM, partial [Planctomycetota bacterium]